MEEAGIPVRVFLGDGTDLGVAHVPPPIQAGDLFALEEGLPLRVVKVAPTPKHSRFHALVEVLHERRDLFRRGGENTVPRPPAA